MCVRVWNPGADAPVAAAAQLEAALRHAAAHLLEADLTPRCGEDFPREQVCVYHSLVACAKIGKGT